MKFNHEQHNKNLMELKEKKPKFDLIEIMCFIFLIVTIIFIGFNVVAFEIEKKKFQKQVLEELQTLNGHLDTAIQGAGLVPAKYESEVQ